MEPLLRENATVLLSSLRFEIARFIELYCNRGVHKGNLSDQLIALARECIAVKAFIENGTSLL